MSWNEILAGNSSFDLRTRGRWSVTTSTKPARYPSSDTTSTDVQAFRLTAEFDLDNSHVGVRKGVIIVIVRGPCVVRCDNDVSSLYTN